MAENEAPRDERVGAGSADDRLIETSAETEIFTPGGSHDVSDVVLAEDETGAAPSFPAPSPLPVRAEQAATERLPDAAMPSARERGPMAMLPGARVDDFEIVRLLGRGAFGHVYLARQLSLDRLVALKVSANRGSEGRTMARLEHQHIVQVFSEKVEPDFNQRLLCMQLVPGIGLERLIGTLHATHSGSRSLLPPEWNGAGLISIIDRSTSLPAALDPSALHDREALGGMDAIEATAWFGGRLAEALDFAHHHGVLHRDIKPANILVNSYGRPLLADFNISSQPVGSEPSGDEMFGGTFAYMAPEHLDAFNPGDPTGPEAVTANSDLYSLGLVLQQLLEGRMSFALPEKKENMVETLRKMADGRRSERPTVRVGAPTARKTMERTLARCLEPKPENRFPSGAALGEQLDGCRRLRQAERQMPRMPAMIAPVLRRPLMWLLVLIIAPQLVGSVVNVLYNTTQIVNRLNVDQKALFFDLVGVYNAIVYPLLTAFLIFIVRPVWSCWRALSSGSLVPDAQVEAARQQALKLPQWVALLTAVGWFPGGVLFPLVIAVALPTLSLPVAAHFIASFSLSGLIALAYSLCGVQWIVLRVIYPGMWSDARSFNDTVRRELAPTTKNLGRIQFAGSMPLVGAMLILIGGDTDSTVFRWLVAGLIILGILGFHFAGTVTQRLMQVIVALTNTKS